MKLLRKHRDEDRSTREEAKPECQHTALIPAWDAPEDMGHEDRATSFRCEGCNAQFTLDEATHLRATEATRLKRKLAS